MIKLMLVIFLSLNSLIALAEWEEVSRKTFIGDSKESVYQILTGYETYDAASAVRNEVLDKIVAGYRNFHIKKLVVRIVEHKWIERPSVLQMTLACYISNPQQKSGSQMDLDIIKSA